MALQTFVCPMCFARREYDEPNLKDSHFVALRCSPCEMKHVEQMMLELPLPLTKSDFHFKQRKFYGPDQWNAPSLLRPGETFK